LNREEKAAAIEEIAGQIKESQAVFAVDYRGITVPQAKELRTRLRDADATFRIVKNTLTERAADAAEAQDLKVLLEGPTALTFVRGDVALAAKALADYQRLTVDKLAFKGGLLDGAAVDAEQIKTISRLPSREQLYGQLVGMVAFPIAGLARTLNQLIGGLAIALAGVQEKKESGEIPAGDPPPPAAAPEPEAQAAPEPEAQAAPEPEAEAAPAEEAAAAEDTEQTDTDNEADASGDAEANE
jgi:large subunit ribosomal protein L10